MKEKIKFVVKFCSYYSPKFVQRLIKEFNSKREKRLIIERMKRCKVSSKQILSVLDKLELDCDVMLHTSRTNIGDLEGGVEFVAEAILNKINIRKHTLLVSALPYRGSFAEYLSKERVFDVRTAPIAMGAINKYFANLPNSIRSIHPTHSVVAVGPHAQTYVSEHHLGKTPFDSCSPYWKLIKNKGKVVLFGATLNNLTCICSVEDLIGKEYTSRIYLPKNYRVKCIDQRGDTLFVDTVCHNPRKSIKRSILFMREGLLKNNIMQVYPLGESEVAVIDIQKFAMCYLDLVDAGISNRGRIKVTEGLRSSIIKSKRLIANL